MHIALFLKVTYSNFVEKNSDFILFFTESYFFYEQIFGCLVLLKQKG